MRPRYETLTIGRVAALRCRDWINRKLGLRTSKRSTMRSASVYLRSGVYYVHPLAGSQGGDPCLLATPVLQTPESDGVEALDALVRQAIEASHHHAPWPTDWKGAADPLLRAAGVRSVAKFMRGAAYVRVDVENGETVVIPSGAQAYRNAFSPRLEQVVRLTPGTEGGLGRAVIEALALCG